MKTIALIPAGDRFEDFFDKIGVSLDTFRDELTGGWLFNYIKALRLAGVRTVLIYASARVNRVVQFTHRDTGAPVWVLPSPRLHLKSRNAQRRFFADSPVLTAVPSYFAIPLTALARVLRHERCDAILCQEYEHPRFDSCAWLGRLLRMPVFATYQGGHEAPSALERLVRRSSIRLCAGLIIPSQHESQRVRSAYNVPPRKIAAIRNPVEPLPPDLAGRDEVRARLGIGAQTRVVAWHGRVQIRTKGLDVLLAAWDRICLEQPHADILLLLVGTGRDAGVLRERLQSSARCMWVNRYVLDRRELWSYLHAADVYTITSRREGFAVAVLEAMACGLPVVASDSPGVIDVVPGGDDDGAIVVPREDTVSLAAALVRMINDPEMAKRFGALAQGRIEEECSLDVVGRRLRQFLFPQSPVADPG
jgi:glycosyltransferase involved in cell wall biosynthesis